MNIKYAALFLSSLFLAPDFSSFKLSAQEVSAQATEEYVAQTEQSQWLGKRVAFLGDSITDKRRVGTKKCYWEYLTEMLGFTPTVYAKSGNRWDGVYKQALKMNEEMGQEVDAIIIFAGTNDYNGSIPLGEWYEITDKDVVASGPETVTRKHREFIYSDDTYRGRINKVMNYLKTNYPTKQIIVLTPIHRGYAKFNDKNIQPEETYSNNLGLFIDDYVNVIKEAANVWAVPVIDLNSLSGIYPVNTSHGIFVAKEDTDRLHPNAEGHYRMAQTLKYQLLALPSSFEK